ncbi:hypothetical protein ACWOAV_05735 [Isobaculum melis]
MMRMTVKTILVSADKKGKLIIYFRTYQWDYGYCPFNKGLPACYRNEHVIINLNQPKYIAEMIDYLLQQPKLDFLCQTVELNNGLELLHQLGYVFDYKKSLNE